MRSTELYKILMTLSKQEWIDLRQYISSPYFKHSQPIITLFEVLFCSIFEKEEIPTKTFLFQETFKSKIYNDLKLRKVFSTLKHAVEGFLVHQAKTNEPISHSIALANEYRNRGLDKHFHKSVRKLKGYLDAKEIQNAEYYESLFAYEKLLFQFHSSRQRTKELNLQEVNHFLDISFTAQKIRQACLALSHQTVFKKEYDLGLIQYVLGFIEERSLWKIPAIGVYYYAYKALVNSDDLDSFYKLKKSLIDFGERFPGNEAGDLYKLAINYCIKLYNRGHSTLLKDEFELYQVGLRKKYLLTKGQISRFTFRNMTTLAIALGELDYLESFIEKYRHFLKVGYQESMYSFCSACLEYERNSYGKALSLLQKAEYKDVLLNLAAKTLMAKIYFELNEWDVLDAHLMAMNTFIRRKEIIGYHQQNYLNTIRFIRRLMEMPQFDKEGKTKLKEELQGTSSVAEKTWLLTKM